MKHTRYHRPQSHHGLLKTIGSGIFLFIIVVLLTQCTPAPKVDQPIVRVPINPSYDQSGISNFPPPEAVSKPVAVPGNVPATPLPIPAPMPPKPEVPVTEPKEEKLPSPATEPKEEKPAPPAPARTSLPIQSTMEVTPTRLEVDLSTQTLKVYAENQVIRDYPISSSKYGIGSQAGSNKTPLGKHYIKTKIGEGAPENSIFQARANSGRIAKINQETGDLVTSRVMWLKESDETDPKFAGANSSYRRFIYIHGTAAERDIGRPASHGCIRMYNKDVIELYEIVKEGLEVEIICSQKDPATGECQYDNVVMSKMTQANNHTVNHAD